MAGNSSWFGWYVVCNGGTPGDITTTTSTSIYSNFLGSASGTVTILWNVVNDVKYNNSNMYLQYYFNPWNGQVIMNQTNLWKNPYIQSADTNFINYISISNIMSIYTGQGSSFGKGSLSYSITKSWAKYTMSTNGIQGYVRIVEYY